MTSLSEEDQEPLKPATGVLTPEDSPASILEQESLEKGIPKGSPVLEQVESVQPPHNVVGSEEPPSSEDLPVPLASRLARMSEEVALLRQDMAKRIEDLEQELERREKYIEDNMVCKTRFDQLQQEMQTQKDVMEANRQLAERAYEQVRQRATRRDLAQTKQQLQVLVATVFAFIAVASYFISPSSDCHLRMAEIETYTTVIPINITVPTQGDTSGSCIGEPFYTHFRGYKVFLVILTGGNETCNEGNIAVGVRLLPGEFDDNLNWPFYGNFTIQLLNRRGKCSTLHYPITAGDRVISSGGTVDNWGCTDVVSNHLNHETLKFRVSRFEQGQKGITQEECSEALERQRIDPECQQSHCAVAWQNVSDEIKQPENIMPIDVAQQFNTLKRSMQTMWSMLTNALPLNITMDNFTQHRNSKQEWYSQPFYTHFHGYKMCLRVDANGFGTGAGTHVSVSLYLMHGEFDDQLSWPFRGKIQIRLQSLEGKLQKLHIIDLNEAKDGANQQAFSKERNPHGWGYPTYFSHIQLGSYLDKQNDSITFQVAVVEVPDNMNGPLSSSQHTSMWSMLTNVLPLNISMAHFTVYKASKLSWYSEPFYTHFPGYKLRLRVDANGNGISDGTHVSVFIYLMHGEFDDKLSWPFHAKLQIRLQNHLTGGTLENPSYIIFHQGTGIRVLSNERSGRGLGIHKYVADDELELFLDKDKDTITFEVALLEVPNDMTSLGPLSLSQHNSMWSMLMNILPLNITMTHWTTYDVLFREWYSDPFYTQFHGYKMRLKVVPANFKGTSVFICMMLGEFDDKLAWPFQGTLKVELLDRHGQWGNSHTLYHTSGLFSSIDTLHRVMTKEITTCTAGSGWLEFVTYAQVKSTYLREDSLTFQVALV